MPALVLLAATTGHFGPGQARLVAATATPAAAVVAGTLTPRFFPPG